MAVPDYGLGRHPIFDDVRLTTTVKIRLGVKKTKGDTEYPSEVDYFVLKEDDGATADMRKLYGEAPKSLRMMLPFEAPRVGEPSDADDLVLSIYNTAWGWNSGLLCKGTGKSKHEPGLAQATDKDFAARIASLTKAKVTEVDGRYQIPCLGVDCPKYRNMVEIQKQKDGRLQRALVMAPGHDPDAPCKLTILFKALLLHPTDPDPANILGVAEIASGSINTIRDVVSGFQLMREFTKTLEHPRGRTALIPFQLIRKITTTTKVARRAHFTLAILPTPKEWQKYARIPTRQMFLPPETIAELRQLREAEISLDSVRDIIPRPLELAAHEGADLVEIERQAHEKAPAAPASGPVVPQGTVDREEAVRAAPAAAAAEEESKTEEPAAGPVEAEMTRILTEAERLALKDLLGGRVDPDDETSPSKPETLERLYYWIREFDREHGTDTKRMSQMTVHHDLWIRSRVEAEAAANQHEDDREIPADEDGID